MNTFNFHWRDFFAATGQIFHILFCLNREDELRRLVEWADSKQLPGPQRAYLMKLGDTERRLFRYAVSTPRLTTLARLLHGFKVLLTPTPRYLPVGSARIYRRTKA